VTALKDTDFVVPAGALARPLDRVLRELLGGASWHFVRRLIQSGKVAVDGRPVLEPSLRVSGGAAITLRPSAPRTPANSDLPREAIIHLDAHVVVVNKPPGISTVPYEDERDTLDHRVRVLLKRTTGNTGRDVPLGVVQRLDKDTSGLIVFCRTRVAKQALQQQFRAKTVHRRYLAIVCGICQGKTLRSRLVTDRGDGRRGSTDNPRLGREAVTHVRALEIFEHATLVECALETGRTHQIRIQLAEAGHPVLGERVYFRKGTESVTLPVAPRQMLHAAELGFVHPTTGRELRFERPPPNDMQAVIEQLYRSRARSAK
jgi:23S rRNA pseudouridine1911/1915/1917 synthase